MLEEELGRMSPDLSAIEAYQKKDADYKARVGELEKATNERDEVPLSSRCPYPVEQAYRMNRETTSIPLTNSSSFC